MHTAFINLMTLRDRAIWTSNSWLYHLYKTEMHYAVRKADRNAWGQPVRLINQ